MDSQSGAIKTSMKVGLIETLISLKCMVVEESTFRKRSKVASMDKSEDEISVR